MIITSTIISDNFFCPNIVDVIPPTINVFLDGSFTTTVVVPVREENWAPFSPSAAITDVYNGTSAIDVIPPTINVFLDGSFTTTVVVPVREENWAPFSPSAAITDVYNGTNVTGVTNIAVKFRQYWG